MLVSVHQAAFNAMARHLETYLGSDVIVSRKWPPSDQTLPPKMVSLIYAGARQDIPLTPQLLRQVDVADPKAEYTYQIRACEQPVQLDVWCRRESDRDDITAKLDDILNMESAGLDIWNPIDHGNGTLVKLADGWTDTFADFYFDSPELLDTPDSVQRSEYRVSYTGTAWFMLSVTRENVKTKVLQVQLSFDDGASYDTF